MNPLGPLADLTGRGVKVALVDSGVNPHHAQAWKLLPGRDFCLSGQDTRDRHGHGTALAGVLRLWAPQAEILPVRIFDHRLACPAGRAQRAVLWAVRQGARVINLSLAGDSPQGWREVIRRALDAGAVLVASRNGRNGGGYPAEMAGVLAVRDSGHPGRFQWSQRGLCAPGLGRHLPGRLANQVGPSLSAAHASGLVARYLQAHPRDSVAEVLVGLEQLFTG